jgi:hypothetical protein
VIIWPLLTSCQLSKDNIDCQKLSYEKFKGKPTSAHEFDQSCQNISIKHTQIVCQKALELLITSGEQQKLNEQFGEGILECFTKADLNLYLKK